MGATDILADGTPGPRTLGFYESRAKGGAAVVTVSELVVMARGLLADPEIPNKVMSNRGDEVVKCLRCFACMAERPVTQTRTFAIARSRSVRHLTAVAGK